MHWIGIAPVGIAYSKITGVDTEDLTPNSMVTMLPLKSHAQTKGRIDQQSRSSSQGTQTNQVVQKQVNQIEPSNKVNTLPSLQTIPIMSTTLHSQGQLILLRYPALTTTWRVSMTQTSP